MPARCYDVLVVRGRRNARTVEPKARDEQRFVAAVDGAAQRCIDRVLEARQSDATGDVGDAEAVVVEHAGAQRDADLAVVVAQEQLGATTVANRVIAILEHPTRVEAEREDLRGPREDATAGRALELRRVGAER